MFKGTLSPIFKIALKRPILIQGIPKILVEFRLKLLYQFSETIIKCVWLRIARMGIVT